MRLKLKRFWCRLMHGMLWKTEPVTATTWRKRCLECGEVFLFEVREA